MTIEKDIECWAVNCDFCSNCEDDMQTFEEAVEWKKENWASLKYKGDWYDLCDACFDGLEERK